MLNWFKCDNPILGRIFVRNENSIWHKFYGDKVLWRVVLALLIVSALAVYSSTGTLAYKYHNGNIFVTMFKHLLTIILSVGLMYLFHLLSYNWINKIAKVALVLTVPLLFATLFVGTNLNSASRWISVGGISFQSSDVAKLSLIAYIAKVLAKNQVSTKKNKNEKSAKDDNPIANRRKVLYPILLADLLVCGAIFPANFSTAAMLFIISLVMMFIGRVPVKQLLAVVGSMVALMGLLVSLIVFSPSDSKVFSVLPRAKTWKTRIETFSSGAEVDQDKSYQSDQAKIAIVTGAPFGKGIGRSTQRNFLPHPYSDFIYAIIVEETGWIGAIFVLGLYVILLYRVGKNVQKIDCESKFPELLMIGYTFSIVFQAFINMAVAVNLIPVTGQTLPLVSMGGSSLFITGIEFGIIIGISRYADIETKKKVESVDSDDNQEKKVTSENEVVDEIKTVE